MTARLYWSDYSFDLSFETGNLEPEPGWWLDYHDANDNLLTVAIEARREATVAELAAAVDDADIEGLTGHIVIADRAGSISVDDGVVREVRQ